RNAPLPVAAALGVAVDLARPAALVAPALATVLVGGQRQQAHRPGGGSGTEARSLTRRRQPSAVPPGPVARTRRQTLLAGQAQQARGLLLQHGRGRQQAVAEAAAPEPAIDPVPVLDRARTQRLEATHQPGEG